MTESNETHKLNGGASDCEHSLSDLDLDHIDYKCHFFIFDYNWLQRFASKKAYVAIHGFVGCFFVSTFAYYNATISTIEKRFQIPSQNSGIISAGYDCSAFISATILSLYLTGSHRPRWVALSAFVIAIYSFLISMPHFIYGPGDRAISLTEEYTSNLGNAINGSNATKSLCQMDSDGVQCEKQQGNLVPQIYLFSVNFICGFFGPLYDSLGTSYMDDNILKSKTPVYISISYSFRLLGPLFGYTFASFSLKHYIAPTLTPTITNEDPRWMGAWWLGWIIIGFGLLIFSFLVAFFPRELPRAAIRRHQKSKKTSAIKSKKDVITLLPNGKPDLVGAFKRVFSNKAFMFNLISAIFNLFGLVPYWMFMPKYIEFQYKQSASTASFLAGTVTLIFTAIGTLTSGFVINKMKPRARTMAAWNIFVGFASAVTLFGYIFLGCSANDNATLINDSAITNSSCIANCHCDYIAYSPVCGEDGITYISPCHAGCVEQKYELNGTQYFDSCLCVNRTGIEDGELQESGGGKAYAGACPIDCRTSLFMFIVLVCMNNFIASTARASNFLLSVRCVSEHDKSFSFGLGTTMISLFAFIPSPIIFGWIIDQTCSVWGKTCTGNGNCWLYDNESLRFWLNITATTSVLIGMFWDCGVWYVVKDLQIFDKEEDEMFRRTKKSKSTSNLKEPVQMVETSVTES